MNLRGHRPSHELARSIFAERPRGLRPPPAAMAGLVAVAILAVAGCKTGGASSPLAWWPGSSKGSADNEKLASAPSFDGKVEKPSETQRPYPTTTTPQSYAIDGQKPPSLASAAAPPGAPPSAGGNSANTYGTPPLAASSPAAMPPPANTGGAAAQVGPYQGWPAGGSGPTATPPPPPPAPAGLTATSSSAVNTPSAATAPSAGSSAGLGFGSASSMTPDALEPPARYADSRFGGATAAASSFSSASSEAAVPPSRYSTSGASQFGGQPVAAPAAPAAFAAPAVPMSPSAAPPAPASSVGDPSALPPQSGVNRLRAPSGSAGSSTPPARRPDPGYRPGGTSTYRPSQAIVSEPADEGPVRHVSFDSPLR